MVLKFLFISPHVHTVPITLDFQQSNYSVNESEGSVSVCVEVTDGIVGGRTFQITLDSVAGDAQGKQNQNIHAFSTCMAYRPAIKLTYLEPLT